MMRSFLLALSAFTLLAPAALANEPILPRPLEQQRLAGAQIYYLGKHGSMNGWVLVRAGQPEFYYAPEDNSAVVMGILFDSAGAMQTPAQLQALQRTQQRDLSDMVVPAHPTAPQGTPQAAAPAAQPQNAPAASQSTRIGDVANELTPASPAEQLLQEVEGGAKLLWGRADVPAVNAFIDPNCGHCHRFLREIAPYVDEGRVAVNILPVGFNARSVKQAAFMLAAGDGVQRLLRYKDGDAEALPEADVSTNAIDHNVGIQHKWSLAATPILLYRTPERDIRLVRGRPLDMAGMIKDLTGH